MSEKNFVGVTPGRPGRGQKVIMVLVIFAGAVLAMNVFRSVLNPSVDINRPNDHLIKVLSEDYAKEWPFPGFDHGWIGCKVERFGATKRPLVTIRLGQTTYGLNGAAIGVGGFPDHTHLLKKHSDEHIYFIPGARSELLQIGLDICDWH